MDEKGSALIAILTDFGDKDPYVAEMKAVMLKINPAVRFLDITHNVKRHSIRSGAFILYTTHKYFPEGTIFLVVIDPGVGTARKPILVLTDKYAFVAPDNGVLYPIVKELSIKKIIWLKNKKYFREEISTTFHGRDIFAPVAAYLSLGIKEEDFGLLIDPNNLVKLELIKYDKKEDVIKAEVNYIDVFGNVITSIPNDSIEFEFGRMYKISTNKGKFIARRVSSYGEGRNKEVLLIKGSHGFWEIALNKGNAASFLGVEIGDELEIKQV